MDEDEDEEKERRAKEERRREEVDRGVKRRNTNTHTHTHTHTNTRTPSPLVSRPLSTPALHLQVEHEAFTQRSSIMAPHLHWSVYRGRSSNHPSNCHFRKEITDP